MWARPTNPTMTLKRPIRNTSNTRCRLWRRISRDKPSNFPESSSRTRLQLQLFIAYRVIGSVFSLMLQLSKSQRSKKSHCKSSLHTKGAQRKLRVGKAPPPRVFDFLRAICGRLGPRQACIAFTSLGPDGRYIGGPHGSVMAYVWPPRCMSTEPTWY